MSQMRILQPSFSPERHSAVREELLANPKYKFEVFYADDGWLPMLVLRGTSLVDWDTEEIPEAIRSAYDMLVFCQMDDFGDLVERDPFPYHYEGYMVFLAWEPDPFQNDPGYVWMPTCH